MLHYYEMLFIFLITFVCKLKSANAYLELNVPDSKNAFDLDLYENILDSELCDEQLKYIVQNDTDLLFEFLAASFRTPKGMLTGNFIDLGNYYQCLGINQESPYSNIEGKYCLLSVPLDQNLDLPSLPSLPEWPSWPTISWPQLPWPGLDPKSTRLKPEVSKKLQGYNTLKFGVQALTGAKGSDRVAGSQLSNLTFNLAVCLPKVCSTDRLLSSIRGLEYTVEFCRLPNDKQWVAGDYVALAVFSLLLLLSILSTAYDIYHQKYLEDPKRINKLYQSFSVYTNTRRLVTYTPAPGALECLDGIRAIAMMWVIVGHTFSSQLVYGVLANPTEIFEWIMSLNGIWIASAPITVDTFFLISGLLLVYTMAGKFTGPKLLKNLHIFYMGRLLRIYPALSAVILMQVSLLNRVADGPYWAEIMAPEVHRCRVYWWPTILHVQNYLTPNDMCLPHSWYVAIDVHLYIVSPLVLYWVLGRSRKVAWSALVGAFLAVMAASTTYNFIKAFPSGSLIPSRLEEMPYYVNEHYLNTLTRASPFFVGMIVGYLLHLYRKDRMVIRWYLVVLLWASAFVIFGLILYSSYPIMQMDWDNQLADHFINSFMRTGWAMAVGWLIFACAQGYGGIINWILSLRVWKIPSRMSYAMYLIHYPMIFVVNAMVVSPVYFAVRPSIFTFLGHLMLSSVVAFLLTILIEAPFSTLVKLLMGGGPRRPPSKPLEADKDQTIGDMKPQSDTATDLIEILKSDSNKTNL